MNARPNRGNKAAAFSNFLWRSVDWPEQDSLLFSFLSVFFFHSVDIPL